MAGTHSFLPPSGASAWKHCPAWPSMNALYPKDSTPESLEGDAAHWVFAEMFEGRFHNVGVTCPNGVVVTEEMVEGAELFYDTVKERTKSDGQVWLNIEKPVPIPHIHKDCWGTPDAWAFIVPAMTLEIIDYKFGHRFVDEFENDQCIAYYAGILDALCPWLNAPSGAVDQRITVNITIVQPRCFYKGAPVRTWSGKGVDLRGNVNQLINAAQRAYHESSVQVTNEDCIDCPGSHACQALQLAGYSYAEYASKSLPIELSPEAASLELKIMERGLELLEARVEGMREAVAAHIRAGKNTPWHRAEQGYGRQTWNLPNDQIIALGKLMGVDLSKEAVKTPKQAEKLGIDETVIKTYSTTPLGSIKVVPNKTSDARRVFG